MRKLQIKLEPLINNKTKVWIWSIFYFNVVVFLQVAAFNLCKVFAERYQNTKLFVLNVFSCTKNTIHVVPEGWNVIHIFWAIIAQRNSQLSHIREFVGETFT